MILHVVFFLIGCLVSGVASYAIINKIYQRQIDKITGKNLFVASLAIGEFPNWEVLNNIPCEAIDACRAKLSNILYQKYFAEKIDFVVLEKFLDDLKKFIACGGKENLIKEIVTEAVANVNAEKMANSVADFIESGGSGKDIENVINLFSRVVRELRGQAYSDFLHSLDSRVDHLIFEATSEERSRILDITFRIK